MSILYRHLPSVDRLLDRLAAESGLEAIPRPLVKDLVNAFLDGLREDIRQGRLTEARELEPEELLPALVRFVRDRGAPRFTRVLNATGVVVHTNMGRSLLAEQAIEAVAGANAYYSNLELDLSTGGRGSRYSHVEELLCRITGAEAALVVNNNAAAVLLVLETLAKGGEVVVSRGQLVEIGGSFRIPEVMAKSGAVLREVGATNRTHPRDYESAISDRTAALMKVHTSNYRIVGFTREVSLQELRVLGERYDLPVIEDLGSGNLVPCDALSGEPTVQSVVAAGADVVTFSGDKVLGGPQAGLIVGREKYISEIKKNPLNRALRIDKMTLAALEATLRLCLDPDTALASIPTLRMITAGFETLKSQAGRLARLLRAELGPLAEVTSRRDASRVGGGSYPERDLPTVLVCVRPASCSVSALRRRLLSTDPPLVARVEEDELRLDPRTLSPSEHKLAARALAQALKE